MESLDIHKKIPLRKMDCGHYHGCCLFWKAMLNELVFDCSLCTHFTTKTPKKQRDGICPFWLRRVKYRKRSAE